MVTDVGRYVQKVKRPKDFVDDSIGSVGIFSGDELPDLVNVPKRFRVKFVPRVHPRS
jgi:hypothetical protein